MNTQSASLQSSRTPVSIITGSLGSGKTTLLSSLLKHPAMGTTLVIVNEFGEVGLDHLLIHSPDEDVLLLENGCLCCTVQGDLVTTLRNLVARRMAGDTRFNRIIIETTGLADPTGVLQTVLVDPVVSAWFSMDAIVCVVDAVNVRVQLEKLPECTRQISVADHIVISKPDLAEPAEVSLLQARLARINPAAHQSVVLMGQIEPLELFGENPAAVTADPSQVDRWLSGAEAEARAADRHVARHSGHGAQASGHRHEGAVTTFTLWYNRPVVREALVLWLNLLANFCGPKLLRIKGLVNVDGTPTVIHGVRHLLHEPVALDGWPSTDVRSRIVFITQSLDRASIESTIPALDFNPAHGAEPLNPNRYGKFVELFQRFRLL